MASNNDMSALRETWKQLYAKTLPGLARAKDSAQPIWPVTLDHCFARIILDNVIGRASGEDDSNVSWDKVIARPAVQNMSTIQLEKAIELGEQIKAGKANLVALDKASLQARGKWEDKYTRARGLKQEKVIAKQNPDTMSDTGPGVKRKRTTVDAYLTSPKRVKAEPPQNELKQLPSPASDRHTLVEDMSDLERDLNVSSTPPLHETYLRIQRHCTLTPYRRRLYTILLSVPRGRYTTYAAMSKYLDSAARAVGNGMRNNPFAPNVPCHRVLAADGTIGGFGGDWDRLLKGKNAKDSVSEKVRQKVKMLELEGVKFDSRGKVKGPVFHGFHENEDWFVQEDDREQEL